MIVLIAVSALFAVCAAQTPVWFSGGQCGVSKYADAGDMALPANAKIVGGQEARPNEFPWQVSVRRASTGGHFCGASIINENWILCAAHCMVGEVPAQVEIVAGEHDRTEANPARQNLAVSAIFVHESYSSRTMENDVSLIKVATPIVLNAEVWPICAPDSSNDYVYQKNLCSGWGTLNSGGACCPPILRYVTMNTTTNAFCQAAYPLDEITVDMVCASDNNGGTERDSCQGDSGGPLAVKDANSIFASIGIVSWGRGCASGYPGVYARTSFQNAWITDKITNN